MPGVLSTQSGITFSNTRVDGARLAEEMDDLAIVNGGLKSKTPVASLGARGGKQQMSSQVINSNNVSNNITEEDATVFAQKYQAAREQTITDLGSFKNSLDEVLNLLSSHIHSTDGFTILALNQAARQHNAALGDRTQSKLAPLRNEKGPIDAMRCTIVELEDLSIDKKIQILCALWMRDHIPAVQQHDQETIDNASDEEERNRLLQENMNHAIANEAHLTRLLRVTVGLPATFGNPL